MNKRDVALSAITSFGFWMLASLVLNLGWRVGIAIVTLGTVHAVYTNINNQRIEYLNRHIEYLQQLLEQPCQGQ